MEVHQSTVKDVPATVKILEDIYDTVETRVGSNYFVLVERQPLDREGKKGLYFNTQLEMVISAFFAAKGKIVKTIEPVERYKFVGVDMKQNRSARKHQVTRKVVELLKTEVGSRAQHDLSHWDPKDPDAADSLTDALFFFYRNWSNVIHGNVVEAIDTATPVTPAPPSNKRQKSKQDQTVNALHVRAALQQLLTDLQISHWDQIKDKKSPAEKLVAVHRQDPEKIAPFLKLLNSWNKLGTQVNTKESRLTHL
jgi:hypothetical protein